jgi:nucleoside-diphosphate-sugar epimerase
MGIVVTGHMGFIGGYLMRQLPNAVGLDIKDGNDILECDLPPADIVIHLAAEPGVIRSVEDPFTNAQTNILGTIRLLQHYKNAKFIFASSGGTIQETIESPYGLSKYTCEEYIKLLHDNYVILRFPNVYGKGSRSVVDKFLNQDKLTIYGDGSANRTYGFVDDVVRGILFAQEWPSGTYKLGGGQNYTVREIAEAIGKPIIYAPKRWGELDHSSLPNETPNWGATLDLQEYIRDAKN